jgi:haloalkane dehalogenase
MRPETTTQPETERAISTEAVAFRKRVKVRDTTMAYVDVGEGDPIVFLHGNRTPSYLWRNIIPRVLPFGRCLAPDFVGMGNSGTSPNGAYRFVDHHSRGRFAIRASQSARVYGGDRPPFLSWNEWPETTREFFKAQRIPEGAELILDKNLFIEFLLPLRGLSDDTIEVYRRHYRNPGPARRPMLDWSRELPIEDQPRDVVQIVDAYANWLSTSPIPKLFINGDPAGFLIGAQREFCRMWPNQQEVTVKGAHFLPEDSPVEVADAIARFVAKVLARQLPDELVPEPA